MTLEEQTRSAVSHPMSPTVPYHGVASGMTIKTADIPLQEEAHAKLRQSPLPQLLTPSSLPDPSPGVFLLSLIDCTSRPTSVTCPQGPSEDMGGHAGGNAAYDSALQRRQALMGESGARALVKNWKVARIAAFACIGGMSRGSSTSELTGHRLSIACHALEACAELFLGASAGSFLCSFQDT